MSSLPPLRWRLRDATAASHARVDALANGLFDDRDGYVGFLQAMHAFARDTRAALGDADAPTRASVARLAADLAALDAAPMPVDAPLPPPAADPFDAVGWRYVSAGSSLGARLLVRRAFALGVDANRGASYLAAHANGRAWPEFLASLDTLPDDDAGIERACAAANAAFSRVADALLAIRSPAIA